MTRKNIDMRLTKLKKTNIKQNSNVINCLKELGILNY